MGQLVDDVRDTLQRLDAAASLDILIIATIIFALLMALRGTTAMTLMRGGVVDRLASVPAGAHPGAERRQLPGAQLAARPGAGRHRDLPAGDPARAGARRPHERAALAAQLAEQDVALDEISTAVANLARSRHGAIIVIERGTGLEDYIESGVRLDAGLNAQAARGHLLPQLAAARQGGDRPRTSASSRLPARCRSRPAPPPARMGTRHRAGAGRQRADGRDRHRRVGGVGLDLDRLGGAPDPAARRDTRAVDARSAGGLDAEERLQAGTRSQAG